MYVCGWTCTCHGVLVEVRGQLSKVVSFLPPRDPWVRLKSWGLGQELFYPLSHPSVPVMLLWVLEISLELTYPNFSCILHKFLERVTSLCWSKRDSVEEQCVIKNSPSDRNWKTKLHYVKSIYTYSKPSNTQQHSGCLLHIFLIASSYIASPDIVKWSNYSQHIWFWKAVKCLM